MLRSNRLSYVANVARIFRVSPTAVNPRSSINLRFIKRLGFGGGNAPYSSLLSLRHSFEPLERRLRGDRAMPENSPAIGCSAAALAHEPGEHLESERRLRRSACGTRCAHSLSARAQPLRRAVEADRDWDRGRLQRAGHHQRGCLDACGPGRTEQPVDHPTLTSAPLPLTGHTVVVTVHSGARAVAQKENGFGAGGHLRAMSAAIAAVWVAGDLGGWLADGGRRAQAVERESRAWLGDHRVAHYRAVVGDVADHRAAGFAQVELPEGCTEQQHDEQLFHRAILAWPVMADSIVVLGILGET